MPLLAKNSLVAGYWDSLTIEGTHIAFIGFMRSYVQFEGCLRFQAGLPVIPSLSLLSRSASLSARFLSSNSAVAPLGWLSAVLFPASAPLQCVASSSGADSEPEVYSCGLCRDSGPEQMSSRFRADLLV